MQGLHDRFFRLPGPCRRPAAHHAARRHAAGAGAVGSLRRRAIVPPTHPVARAEALRRRTYRAGGQRRARQQDGYDADQNRHQHHLFHG